MKYSLQSVDSFLCIFGDLTIHSGKSQVVPENENRALYSTHSIKILFKEGGCGTFVPLFFNLISSVRQYHQQTASMAEPRMDPLQAAQTPVDEMMRHAYVFHLEIMQCSLFMTSGHDIS